MELAPRVPLSRESDAAPSPETEQSSAAQTNDVLEAARGILQDSEMIMQHSASETSDFR